MSNEERRQIDFKGKKNHNSVALVISYTSENFIEEILLNY